MVDGCAWLFRSWSPSCEGDTGRTPRRVWAVRVLPRDRGPLRTPNKSFAAVSEVAWPCLLPREPGFACSPRRFSHAAPPWGFLLPRHPSLPWPRARPRLPPSRRCSAATAPAPASPLPPEVIEQRARALKLLDQGRFEEAQRILPELGPARRRQSSTRYPSGGGGGEFSATGPGFERTGSHHLLDHRRDAASRACQGLEEAENGLHP
jgi:hypothetical protein